MSSRAKALSSFRAVSIAELPPRAWLFTLEGFEAQLLHGSSVELFRDGFHLNNTGCARFSVMMAQEVGRLLR